MEIEEVKKFLQEDANGKKLLDQLVQENEQFESLKNKNFELIGSNGKLKKERDKATTRAEEIEAKMEELGENDVSKAIEKETAKLKKENETLVTENTSLKTDKKNNSIKSSLDEALQKANIAKEHMPAIRALIRSENKIDIDEVDNNVKIGDKDIISFVSEWSQGDVGKNYIAASQNSGGGAKGSSTGGKSSNEDLMKMDPKQRLIEARKQGVK